MSITSDIGQHTTTLIRSISITKPQSNRSDLVISFCPETSSLHSAVNTMTKYPRPVLSTFHFVLNLICFVIFTNFCQLDQ